MNKNTDDKEKKKIMMNIDFIQKCMNFRCPPNQVYQFFNGDDKYFLDQMNKSLIIGHNGLVLLKNKENAQFFLDRMNYIQKCIFIMTHPDQEYIRKNIDLIDDIYKTHQDEFFQKSFKHFMPYK
jgi:hypothetical protein